MHTRTRAAQWAALVRFVSSRCCLGQALQGGVPTRLRLGEEQDEQDDENQGADADVHGVPPRQDVIAW